MNQAELNVFLESKRSKMHYYQLFLFCQLYDSVLEHISCPPGVARYMWVDEETVSPLQKISSMLFFKENNKKRSIGITISRTLQLFDPNK